MARGPPPPRTDLGRFPVESADDADRDLPAGRYVGRVTLWPWRQEKASWTISIFSVFSAFFFAPGNTGVWFDTNG